MGIKLPPLRLRSTVYRTGAASLAVVHCRRTVPFSCLPVNDIILIYSAEPQSITLSVTVDALSENEQLPLARFDAVVPITTLYLSPLLAAVATNVGYCTLYCHSLPFQVGVPVPLTPVSLQLRPPLV